MMRRVCIAIGVSRAEGLAPLRAAATAAEEVGQWAELSGFAERKNIQVLTDRGTPVTIELIAETLERLLPTGTQTDALLLHYAGHGLREDNTRTLWLPTDWRTKLRAIAVERLKNRLSGFGIANVTIVSDACKALATDKDTSDLTPDGVLGAGTNAGSRPIFDRFDAVHDVETAFMIPGPTPAQSRCLFSGALVEALWGAKPAIDPSYPGKVTPGSLADYLTGRVAELCATYRLVCEPQNLPGRPADHLIYFDETKVDPQVIPSLPPWPAPMDGRDTSGGAQPKAGEKGAFDDEGPTAEVSVTPDGARRGGRLTQRELQWLDSKTSDEVERASVARRQAKRSRATADAFLVSVIPPLEEANLVVGGGTAKAIWSRKRVRRVDAEQWHAEVEDVSQQLVVEYEDGIFVPLVVYQNLGTVAARDVRGTNGWLFRGPYDNGKSLRPSVEILNRMQSGNLPPSEVDKVAAKLRESKHANPVLGAVCSYLYDYTGDIDSVRRVAYFYTSYEQAIPYDVALMGELSTRRFGSGYVADVPAVAKRRPGGRRLPTYVTKATPKADGPVGGLCPWLRQGWDAVEAPTDREAPLVDRLPNVRRHLLPETFTSLTREGGEILTAFWGMKRWR